MARSMVARTRRPQKMASLMVVAAASVLTFGSVGVRAAPTVASTADPDDRYVPAATQVSLQSTSIVFGVTANGQPSVTITCTDSAGGGKTPAAGLAAFKLNPVLAFDDGPGHPCMDNLGFTDTITTNTTFGSWKVGFTDSTQPGGSTSGDESATEPNSGDKLILTIPQAGMVINNSTGCVFNVAPSGSVKVKGSYDDAGKLVFHTGMVIAITGPSSICPDGPGATTFQTTYTLTPGVSDGS
jgi:hypothetical protein